MPGRSRLWSCRSRLWSIGLALATLALAPIAAAAPAEDIPQISFERLCGDTGPGMLHCHALRRTDVLAHLNALVVAPSGFSPADLQDAYNLPSAIGGSGMTVAIVDAYDNPHAEQDLAVYRSQWGLPACTTANGCFKKLNQRGVAGGYPTFDKGWAGEIALDLDMVSAGCPLCKIVLIEADTNADLNLYKSVDLAASLGVNAISNSYGSSEYSSITGYESHFNHPGIAITVSSGDSAYGVEYPASSQYVTAVGGTSLQRDSSARGWREKVWYQNLLLFKQGSGSGCSKYIAKPSWQTDGGCAKRTVADVAAVADPGTGVAVYDTNSGGWTVFGGTSAASPLVAATYALAKNPAGVVDAGSAPYARAANLYDVTLGKNGSCGTYLCTAGLGYDGPTGLGTPDGVAAFQAGGHLSVSPSSVGAGSLVQVAWSNLQNPTASDWLGLYRAGAADTDPLGSVYVSCSQTPTVPRATGACSVRVPSTLAAGAYDVRLFANDGFTRLSSASLAVVGGSGQVAAAAPTARPSGGGTAGVPTLEARP